jgi:hypothetical protein
MIHGITYTDENMTKSAALCVNSMRKNGVESYFAYRPYLIQDSFINFNSNIFKVGARGADCYWLFKPYIIYVELMALEENDILIYSDAGVEFINNVSHIIDRMDEDIFFFGNNWNHVDWCKMDVIMAINRGDVSILAKQIQASVIFFRNTQKVRDFVKEWLLYCQMPNFIDDSPSKLLNVFTFQEHRHDQAILTSLQIKHGYKLHWWPASYSDGQFTYDKIEQYQNDNYPVIFNHHRKRNDE